MAELKYKIIDINKENVDRYGLFCLKSKSREEGYRNKLQWFFENNKKGLRYKMVGVPGEKGFSWRGFIEYMPGEHAWRGVDAKGWMVIHCIWVIGRNKGQGLGSKLVEACMKDAEGMNGVAVVTSKKNWLPGEKLFIKCGFKKADEMPPLELYAKRLKKDAMMPRFNLISKRKLEGLGKGLVIFESPQCPYSQKAVKSIKEMADKAKIPSTVRHVSSHKEAQKNGCHPYGTFCVVLDGKAVSYYPGDTSEVREAIAEKEGR